MKKTRILSLLLGLSLLCTLIVPATVYADDPPTDSGMKISKTATANADGSYTITLEAFATGAQTTTTETKDIPTDIILVLDQSGSMADKMGGHVYTAYEQSSWGSTRNYHNDEYYPLRHNSGSGNLWHKLNNNEYVAVSVEQEMAYTIISDWDNGKYNSYQNNLYCLINGEYKKVTVTRNRINYTYYVGEIQIGKGKYSYNKPEFENGYAPLYQADTKYIYSYTLNGTTTKIDESIGADATPNTQFYKREYSSDAGERRLDALKNAANAFANAVAEKAAGPDGDINITEDNINHRIAVVGYADTDWDYGYNTGVFIGSTLKRYKNDAAGVYGTALQDMSTTGGKNNVTASLNALTASGATRTDYGLTMAKGILNANPVPQGETRNRVVIVFTDGAPTDYSGFQKNVANSAITAANTIKTGGTTVYSIGIFSGADASSAGTEPNGDLRNNSSQLTAACNWFMQQVSSNNGTPRSPGYYLSAGDSASLNSIFQQISNNITTGGSATTLGSETVVKDIISPYFTLPAGTMANNIQINTYDCTGKNGDTYTWSSTSGGNGGATATVNGDQVSVTGFDFSENWCGTETGANGTTTVRGKKLVISFTVDPKSDFLGGNDVITNASAGIYENSSAQTPVMTFEQPTVNVPIKDVTVTAEGKNVYLLGGVTADQLKDGATVKVGDVQLDLSRANDADKPYGLEKWQTEYVNITVAVKDKDGNAIPADGLKDLTNDATYTVEVTVTPKTTGSEDSKGTPATEKSGENTPAANIYVFKPELTFKDSQIDLGEKADYKDNKVPDPNFEVWKHGDMSSDNATMIGTKPTLDLTYAPPAAAFREDTPVKVTVKIATTDVTEKTTFKHNDCGFEGCKWDEFYAEGKSEHGNAHFIVHVKSFDLTIVKTGSQPIDENQSFVFRVKKDDDSNFSMDVVIHGDGQVTIKGLKPGTYTVTEEIGWSWRYKPGAESQQVNPATATEKDEKGAVLVTFTNVREKSKWLNGSTWCENRWATKTAIKPNGNN